MNAYTVVKQFEEEIAKYAGSKYAVSVTSCTEALMLACAYHKVQEVSLPKRTYVGVPMSVIHAGGKVKWDNRAWLGAYKLEPYPIWDSAKWLTRDIYRALVQDWEDDTADMVCLSLHWAKTLALGQGGVILTNSKEAVEWLKRARFDGRTEGVKPKDDKDLMIGWHCYMSPKEAADALCRLAILPDYNEPIPDDGYPDLSQLEIFK